MASRPVFQEDANSPLLIGPLVIVQVLLLGFANHLPKERLVSHDNHGRLVWIKLTAVLLGLGNAALAALVVWQQGPSKGSIGEALQVAVVLTPTIVAAVSVPVLVHLFHAWQLQWTPGRDVWWWCRNNNKKEKQAEPKTLATRKCIDRADHYGFGLFVYERTSWPFGVCVAWIALVVAYAIYTALYWDVTGGSLNIAGIFAVGANIVLPTWNKGDGTTGFQSPGESTRVSTERVQNVVEIHSRKLRTRAQNGLCCSPVALCLCGSCHHRRRRRRQRRAATVQRAEVHADTGLEDGLDEEDQDEQDGDCSDDGDDDGNGHEGGQEEFMYDVEPADDLIIGFGRHRLVANAHAAITDYRPVLAAGTGRPSTHAEMTERINDSVEHFLQRVRGVYSVACKEEVALENLSVRMGTIAEEDAWTGQNCQRRRLLAAAHAQIWLQSTVALYGNHDHVDRQAFHSPQQCRCLVHRWTGGPYTLEPTPQQEAAFLLGSPWALPRMEKPQLPGWQYGNGNPEETAEEFFRHVWDSLRCGSPHKQYRPALLYFFVLAMERVAGLADADQADYYPSFNYVGRAYTKDDLVVGCIFSLHDGSMPIPNSVGKPQLGSLAQRAPKSHEILGGTVYKDENTTGQQERTLAPPTSKAMVHMALRITARATLAQQALWSLRSVRSILVAK